MLQFFTLLSLAVALVQGLVVPDFQARDTPSPLALGFSIQKSVGNVSVSEWKSQYRPQYSKRGYSEPIVNEDVGYFLNVYLGSNKQQSNVLLDTGSSDLWVPTESYNNDTSSTSKDTGNIFSIRYLDGSSADGEYYLDTLTFDSEQPVLPNFEFAAAQSSSFGVFGIADKDQESSKSPYDNFPWALQKAGIIPKASYSLYLGEDQGNGTVIFGGIDTEKYEGNLTKYSIDTKSKPPGLFLDVQSVNVAGQQVNDGSRYVLDSGTSSTLVSQEVLNFLNKVFNADQNGNIDCDQPNEYISFNFGQNIVKVPYADAIFQEEDGTCSLVFSTQPGVNILGDIFLRNAYVYYDLTDQTISLAQVKYSSESNIITA